jgi:hypothetical protein
VPGLATDHDHLPGSAAATREIALAATGRGPTCESLADATTDAVPLLAIAAAMLAGAALLRREQSSTGSRERGSPAAASSPISRSRRD